jgi:hypothetical protein
MLTILSMLAGFASSLAPELLKRWQDASDKKHELAMTQLQIEAAERGYQYKADEVGVQAYRDIVVAAHQEQADSLAKASQWVVNLSAAVRPNITYLFMVAFIGFKISSFVLLLHPTLPWQQSTTLAQALAIVWSEEDSAMFGAIMAFWFGDRSMAKRRAG